VTVRDIEGDTREATWGIAVESPVQVNINGAPWTVMLASPADLEDLAVGLAITERVLRNAAAIQRVDVSEYLNDLSVDITVDADAIDDTAQNARSLVSSTACGLCGIESLAQLQRRAAELRPTAPLPVSDNAIRVAFNALAAHQPVNDATRSVHAAAWCRMDGDIVFAREDVGRHNALDKLVGALARQHLLETNGFVVMSSRCSYELVYKAFAANAQLLATISAPTTMALLWARALQLPLACQSGHGRFVRFDLEVANGY
jgi:FdhD protein